MDPHKQCKFIGIPEEIAKNILKFLLPNDLVALSLTCKTMKLYAELYFEETHRYKNVKIEVNDNGKIKVWCDKYCGNRYATRVGGVYLENRSIHSSATSKLFQFVKLNCAKRIRCLALDISPCQDQCEIENIKQFKNLEILYMQDPNIVEGVLSHCKSLKALIWTERSIQRQYYEDNWMNNFYPNLKVLILVDANAVVKPNIDLIHFLSNAPKLQAIVLDNLSAIRSFLQSGRMVSYAAFWFDDAYELINVLSDIITMCKQDQIESLHLFVRSTINQYARRQIFKKIHHLKNIKGFHFISGSVKPDDETNVPFMNVHDPENLQTLCINGFKMLVLNQIIVLFPNLKKLHIYEYSDKNNKNFKQYVMLIASQHKNLKQFNFYADNNIEISYYDVHEMNATRSQLVDPSFLTIQTNVDVIDTKCEFISITKSTKPYCLSCKMINTVGFKGYKHALAYLETLPI